MTQAQLIAAMLDAAAPIVKSYWTDLRHDARLIAEAPEGSTFLWAPRPMGSFVILLQRAGRPNVRAGEIFSAMIKAEPVQWRYFTVGQDGACSLVPITGGEAYTCAWEATKRAMNNPAGAVSELHL